MADLSPFPIPRELRQTEVLVGDGGTVYGPFDFKCFDTIDVKAYVRRSGEKFFSEETVVVDKVGGAPFDFFTVTFSPALSVFDEFIVSGKRLPERSAGVKKGGRLDPTALEKELSKIAVVGQELRRDIGRAVSVDYGGAPLTIAGDIEDGRPLVLEGSRIVGGEALENFDEKIRQIKVILADVERLREEVRWSIENGNGLKLNAVTSPDETDYEFDSFVPLGAAASIELYVAGGRYVPGEMFSLIEMGENNGVRISAPGGEYRIIAYGPLNYFEGVAQGAASDIENDSDVPGANVKDALETLRGTFQTKAEFAAAKVPAPLSTAVLLGYDDAGDCPLIVLRRSPGVDGSNVKAYHFVDGNGGYWQLSGASFDPKQLGVKGDYTTNDSVAFQRCLDFFSATKMPCVAGPMNIGVVGSFDLPSGFRMRGVGPHDINTWLETNDKANLRPGYKHLIKGTNIILKGAATKTYTTNRTNDYQSMSYGLLYGHRERPMLEGIGIIQDMDVYNAGGAATSKATDNRSNYDVGLIMRCYSGRMTNVNIFGYWKSGTAGVQLSGKNGFVLHSQTSYDIVDSDYFMAMQCQFTGVAILGGDVVGDQGLTGSMWVACQFYNGADHHAPVDGDYTKPAIYIDGYVEPPAVTPPALPSLIYGIRGHSFIGGHLRTRNNEIIRLGFCDRVRLEFTASETPIAYYPGTETPVPGADQQGKIVGTPGRTGKVYIGFSAISAGNSSWRINEFASQCASLIAIGGQGSDEILLTHRTAFRDGSGAETGSTVDGVRLYVSTVGDPSIQLTGNPTSETDGWVIQRDRSDGGKLRFRFNSTGRSITFNTSGGNLTF